MNNQNQTCEPVYSYPEKEARRAYTLTGLALLVLYLTVQTVASVLMVACQIIFPSLVDQGWFLLALNFVAIYVAGFPFFLLVIRNLPEYSPVKRKMPAGKLAVATLISIGLIYSLSYITNFAVAGLEFILGFEIPSGLDETLASSSLWIAIVSTVVVAPIAEEYMFRKLICDRTAVFGEWQSILISGIAFSQFHGSIHQLLYTFALGCFFAFVYIRTGKLIYTVILHFVVNFIGSVPSLLITEFTNIEQVLEELSVNGLTRELLAENAATLVLYLAFIVVVLSLMVAGVILFFVNIKKIISGADGRYMPRGKRFSIMFGNVGIWIFAAFCFMTVLLNIFSPIIEELLS